MKQIIIFIGCWVHQFVNDIKFFDALEKTLGCTVKRRSTFTYVTTINNSKITFQFCFGPNNDNVWKERKRIRTQEGLQAPPSIEHLAKKNIKADGIYYLGFCGVLKGEKHNVYLPDIFIKLDFKEYAIHHKHVDEMILSKKIYYPNKLLGIIHGKRCTTVTSNQVLSLKYVNNHSNDVLKALSKKLARYADVVEMENYELIKHFGKKYPIGIFLYGTDIPSNKKYSLQSQPSKFNWNKFNKLGIGMIKKIVSQHAAKTRN